MDIYKLMRDFWDWAFENPEKVKPNHPAIYFFAIQHCNRLGWKKKFGLPSTMVMEATGIKSYNTYITSFRELVEFGFIDLIEKSKNQYSSNIIALSNFNKANSKALDKATTKHVTKQHQSNSESIDSIIIPINNSTNLPINNITDKEKTKRFIPPSLNEVIEYCQERKNLVDPSKFIDHYTSNGWMVGKNKMKDWKASIRTWEKNSTNFNQNQNGTEQPRSKAEQLNADMADFARRHGLLPDTPTHGGFDSSNEFTDHTEL
jgi:hypothetical protein